MRLAGELKRVRRARGLEQAQAAVLMKVSQQTVSKWENGGRPDRDQLPGIAEFLGHDLDVVAALAYADEPVQPPALEGRLSAVEDELREVHEELLRLRADVARLVQAMSPGRAQR